MLIDIYDHLRIQRPAEDAGRSGLRFEAAWNTDGAVCVAHTRVPENVTLEHLGKVCPRLRGLLGEVACTAEAAASGRLGPVLLFNKSCSSLQHLTVGQRNPNRSPVHIDRIDAPRGAGVRWGQST